MRGAGRRDRAGRHQRTAEELVEQRAERALLDRLSRRLAARRRPAGLSCPVERRMLGRRARNGAESDRLTIVKMEGFARLIEDAGAAGGLSAGEIERLVKEAASRGIGEGDARRLFVAIRRAAWLDARQSWRSCRSVAAENSARSGSAPPSLPSNPRSSSREMRQAGRPARRQRRPPSGFLGGLRGSFLP